MNFQKVFLPIAGVVIVAASYRAWGWQGVLLSLGGVVFWLLLHFNRMLSALKKAAGRPIGYVPSAVMLNAKLKSGVTLLHVVALTRSLGELQSGKDVQPEVFRWTDTGGSHVTCTFVSGKLAHHELWRPAPEEPTPAA
jgi:hypothetical protein